MSDGDTQPGYRRPRSSRPPADRISDLPEPSSTEVLAEHVRELHRDQRAMRVEVMHRIEGARDAIYGVQRDVTRIDAALAGLRTSQEHATKLILEGRARDRWISIMVVALLVSLLAVLVLRMYGLIGI